MTNMHTLLQDSINNIKNISTLQQAKPLLYLGLSIIALVYLIQRAIVGSKQKSRVASRSPDPEKPTQTRSKAPERPDGGEC
jgi:hypothetical protein